METTIAGKTITVNHEGYLTDFTQWNKDIAQQIALDEGIGQLTARHWAIIEYLQNQHNSKVNITIRAVGKSGVTDIKEFYELFPGGPLKKATKIAGIPKPVGCI